MSPPEYSSSHLNADSAISIKSTLTRIWLLGIAEVPKVETMKKLREISIMLVTTIVLSPAQITQAAGIDPAQSASATDEHKDKSTPQFRLQRYPRYELRASDVLDITFEFTPEFNQTVTVQPDGYISLRGMGDVHVAGRTVPEITETIHTAYGTILQNPSISIVLKDFEKPYVVVGGQVGRPGKYELRGDMTVTEAIAIAGGFNNSAKHSQIVLFRRVSPDWYEAKLINVKKILKTRDLNEDTRLKPGDMLFVPQNTLSKVKQFVPSPGLGLGTTF